MTCKMTMDIRKPPEIRQKRGLIFQGGGVAKAILGAIYPLYLEDPVKWRQLNCGYNLQAQYSVPTTPLYWWDKWEGRSLLSAKQDFDKDGTYINDESRKFIYYAIETFMISRGKNGHKCLLRAICENGGVDDSIGVFSEILHVILTPGTDVDIEYRNAFRSGKSGIDCLSVYPCQKGDGIFDTIAVTISNWI